MKLRVLAACAAVLALPAPAQAEPVLYAIFTVNPSQPTTCRIIAIESPGAEAPTLAMLEDPAEAWPLKEPEVTDPGGCRRRVYHRPLDGKNTLELLLAYHGAPRGISARAEMSVFTSR